MKQETRRLLSAFVKKDDPDATRYTEPFRQEDCVIATDNHAAIIIRGIDSNTISNDEIRPPYPNVLALINKKKEVVTHLTREMVDKEIARTDRLVDSYGNTTCKECDGEGWVNYYYTSSRGKAYTKDEACPICGGTGRISANRVEILRYQIDPEGMLSRNEMIQIQNIMEWKGLDKIELYKSDRKDRVMHVDGEDFHALFMLYESAEQ